MIKIMPCEDAVPGAIYDLDIEADDIGVTVTVAVVWQIV